MTSSANRRLVPFLVLAAAALSAPAFGQGAPRNITPSPYLDPESLAPADEGEEEPLRIGEFETAPLTPLDPGAIGMLSGSRAGYPATLWQGSRAGRVLALIAALPGGTRFPAANAMARKILLSAAPLPSDETVSYSVEPYLYARLERLYAGGDLGALLYLFEQIPRHERSQRLSQLMVEAYLLDGDFATACILAEDGQRDQGSAEWLKIGAICRALERDQEAARLALSLLEEEGEADPAFANLLEDVMARVAGRARQTVSATEGTAPENVPSFFERSPYLASELTPLHVALLKLFGEGVDVDVSSGAPSNLMLSALARFAALSLETKMKVADLALANGALDQEFLSELAAAYRFAPEDRANPYLLDYQAFGLKGDALFYALALEAREPSDAVRFIREGWARSRAAGRAPFLAPLFQKALRRIPADAAWLPFAPDAVRIYLSNGDFIRALGWYNVARDAAAAGDAEAARILVEAWPLMVTMDTTEAIPFSSDILDLWNQSLGLLPEGEQKQRRDYLAGALSALGIGAAPEGGTPPVAVEPPSPFLGPSLGETVAQCLAAIGREGPDPKGLHDMMRALIASGLQTEALALALEIFLARGF